MSNISESNKNDDESCLLLKSISNINLSILDILLNDDKLDTYVGWFEMNDGYKDIRNDMKSKLSIHLMFLIDNSLSMNNSFNSETFISKINGVKLLLKKLLLSIYDRISENTYITIVTTNYEKIMYQEKITNITLCECIQKIDKIIYNSNSSYSNGLNIIETILNSSIIDNIEQNNLIFISDGLTINNNYNLPITISKDINSCYFWGFGQHHSVIQLYELYYLNPISYVYSPMDTWSNVIEESCDIFYTMLYSSFKNIIIICDDKTNSQILDPITHKWSTKIFISRKKIIKSNKYLIRSNNSNPILFIEGQKYLKNNNSCYKRIVYISNKTNTNINTNHIFDDYAILKILHSINALIRIMLLSSYNNNQYTSSTSTSNIEIIPIHPKGICRNYSIIANVLSIQELENITYYEETQLNIIINQVLQLRNIIHFKYNKLLQNCYTHLIINKNSNINQSKFIELIHQINYIEQTTPYDSTLRAFIDQVDFRSLM